MDAAWRQIGDVLEAQRRIRIAQLTKQVSWIWQRDTSSHCSSRIPSAPS